MIPKQWITALKYIYERKPHNRNIMVHGTVYKPSGVNKQLKKRTGILQFGVAVFG